MEPRKKAIQIYVADLAQEISAFERCGKRIATRRRSDQSSDRIKELYWQQRIVERKEKRRGTKMEADRENVTSHVMDGESAAEHLARGTCAAKLVFKETSPQAAITQEKQEN